MKEKDLSILDAYNQVPDLPSKDVHYDTSISIRLSKKNKENIKSNQIFKPSLSCNNPNIYHTT